MITYSNSFLENPLRHLTEVVVLLYGFLKHLFLVLPLLSQLLQDLGFVGLKNV